MWTRTQHPALLLLRLILVGAGALLCWAGGLLSSTLLSHPRSGETSAGWILMAMILGLGGLGAFLLAFGMQGDAAFPPAGEAPLEGRPPLSPRLRAAAALAGLALAAQLGAAVAGAWPPWRIAFQAHVVFWSLGFAASVAGLQGLLMGRRVGWSALLLTGPFTTGLLIDDARSLRGLGADALLNLAAHAALVAAALLCLGETRWRWMLR